MFDLRVDGAGVGGGPVRLILRDAGSGGTSDDRTVELLLPPSPIYLWLHLALKLLLNTVSTASMGILDRIRGNHMIQVNPTNKKLIDRGSRIIAVLRGLSYRDACFELHRTLQTDPPAGVSPVAATLELLS